MAENEDLVPSIDVPAQRGRGRPARLSHEMIVAKAVELLEVHAAGDVTLITVAKAMSTPVMSIYKYFPNRETLLMASASEIFSRLELPEPQGSWQETVMASLWALQELCQRYPVAFKVMDINNEATSSMLRVNAHFLKLFRPLGLQGGKLAFAHSWFMNTAIGFIATQVVTPAARHSIPLKVVEELPHDSQVVLLELRQHLILVKPKELLEFGFQAMIRGLEHLLPPSA